jgi:single-stranded-DNA-specific exonuclease
VPEITVDAIIELKDINPKMLRIINQFAPFGPGNMSPTFMAENLVETGYAKTVGKEEAHLKLAVTQNDRFKIGGIGFNLGDKLPLVTSRKPFSAVFSIDENEWKGNISLQLKLKDIK